MNNDMKQDAPRLAWVEPKIEELDVQETAHAMGLGGDTGPAGMNAVS